MSKRKETTLMLTNNLNPPTQQNEIIQQSVATEKTLLLTDYDIHVHISTYLTVVRLNSWGQLEH